jgi:hypothetical protein
MHFFNWSERILCLHFPRYLTTLVLVLLTLGWLTACVAPVDQLAGSYITVITPMDIPTGFGSTEIAPEDIDLLSGRWQITFQPDGRFSATHNGEVMIEEGRYQVNNNLLTVGQERGPAACVGEPRLLSGTYQWTRQGDALRLLVVNDKCGGRTVVFAAHPWVRTPSAARSGDPAALFAAFNAAVNAHDVDTALSYFAADAVAELPPPYNRRTGSEEIRQWLEADIAQNIHVVVDQVQVSGETVQGIAHVEVDELRAAGVTLVGAVEVRVEGDKIVAFRYTLDDATLQKLQSLGSQ